MSQRVLEQLWCRVKTLGYLCFGAKADAQFRKRARDSCYHESDSMEVARVLWNPYMSYNPTL
jgi:hypothetical protein